MQFSIRLLRRSAGLLAGGLLAFAVLSAAPAAAAPVAKPSVQSVVTTRKQRATRFAAAGKYVQALDEISKARERVRDAISTSGASLRRPAPSPAYAREVTAARKWYAERVRKSPNGRGDAALAGQYRAKLAALRKKYGSPEADAKFAAQQKEQSRRIAQLMLTMADLEELSATYHTRKKDTDQAQIYKVQAWTTRLDAQRILGNAAGATKAAEALLRLNPPDPGVYSRIGSYYQGAGQYQKASGVWSRGIKLLETGSARLRTPTGSSMSEKNRSQLLGQFYRQQAFCFAKTGRKSESDALIRKAAAVEASVRRP